MSLARSKRQSNEPLGPDSGRPPKDAPLTSETISNADPIVADTPSRFINYAWLVLVYNLLVVGWGVFVRAGKYGDGCGSHWPLCDGDSTPLMGPIARIVESSHRISTALVGPLVLILLVSAIRRFPRGHLVRKAAWGALGMTLFEGAVGAALVKFGLVTMNDSPLRAGVMAFHVVSTFLLLGFLGMVLVGATMPKMPTLKGQGTVAGLLTGAAFGLILLGVTGAISALGRQINPVDDVLKAAMDPTTFWMVRVQPLHPLIGATVGLYILLVAGLVHHLRPDPRVRAATRWMVGLFLFQVGVGALSIYLKAPIYMQMLHLVVADINWLSLVAVAMLAFAPHIEAVERREAPPEATEDLDPLNRAQRVGAYVALTKPRVISLLLLTCLAAMVAAKGEWPGLGLFLAVGVAGYMAAGAANAINMVVDRDIDLAMKRTATRPTVTQAIPSQHALWFAFGLALLSFGILWAAANLLSALMAFSGLVFYVVVYTLLLKRRTWHNIVIGGAAGAFPPLVGWAAVTNELPPLALALFGIIFVWTPVHFWALALLLKDDYASAGVPMLPVVKGERNTVVQIAAYAALTVAVTMGVALFPGVGWAYLAGAALLNLQLLWLCLKLFRNSERAQASSVFHFSMVYLALLFVVFAADRVISL